MGTKYNQRPQFSQGPTWADIHDSLSETMREFGVQAKLLFRLGEDQRFYVECRVWRDDMGAPLGISLQLGVFPHPSHKTIEGMIFRLVTQAHHDVYNKVYSTPYTHGVAGPGR